DKSPEVKKAPETKVEVVEVANVTEVKNQVKSVVPKNETIVEELKVVKSIGADIPTSCAMWSDGCNVCTRLANGKASCTSGAECKHKMFSCLQWQ
ncbi:MAG: Unknown protein, partial [uncultured Sulfurovum sp.]